jgi:ComEC/Rec2-related protein
MATIRGEIVSSPVLRRSGFADRLQLQVNVNSTRIEGRWQPARGRILISTTNQLGADYFAGQRIQVDGVLGEPDAAASPGLYDHRETLYRRGIHRELRTDEFSHWELLPQSPPPSRPVAHGFRNWARNNLSKGMGESDEALELLWAMSLGWRTALTSEVAAPFMQTGTMHLFAISGLHIALVAGILVALLRVMRLPKNWAGAVAIPLLWFYTAATGWQPSAVRASVMMTLILGSWALKRPVNVLNSLGAAAFLILLWDPQQLFRASFQLSFVVVFSLAIVLPHFNDWLRALIRPDPFLPRQLWSWRRRWLLALGYWVIGGLAVSISAWLASAPLVANYFHLFSPIGLLVNVPVVLCGGLALASCMGSLLCGGWLEPVTVLFNHSAWFFMRCMMAISQWGADFPGAWQYVRSPAPWMMAGWYALLFGLGTGRFLKPAVRRWALGGGVVFALLLVLSWQTDRQEVRITMLPGGPMVHMEAAAHRPGLLIDTGDAMAVEYIVPRHLRTRGVDELSAVALTHGIGHHVGGFTNLLAAQPLERVYLSHAKSLSKYQKTVLKELAQRDGMKRVVAAGDTIGPWTVLHPAKADDFPKSSDDALVLRGEFHGVRVLLLSDLGAEGCQALMAREIGLRADIVVVSIPSYGEPLNPGLLRIIEPRVIVVHDSQFPITKRAPAGLLKRLSASGAKVFSVRVKKGIRLSITSRHWQLENSAGVLWRSRPL